VVSFGQTEILVQGAREHNLKDVTVRIPRGTFTTVSGVSGSGKSSLAFDTIFKEGQRRFVESLSSYARQFLGQGEKPRVDHIEGLSPTVSIDQKTVSRNPRSTVGTITEVYDHLRLLFARLGTPHCPKHGLPVAGQTPEAAVDRVLDAYAGRNLMILATVVRDRKGEDRKEVEELRTQGYVRARIDGRVRRLDEPIELKRYERHTIQVVVDRIKVGPDRRARLVEAVEEALRLGKGSFSILDGAREDAFSSLHACPECGRVVPDLEPRLFSHNSPHGACHRCGGLGRVSDVDPRLVVPDPDLSIDEGAVLASEKGGWKLRRYMRPEILRQVCDALHVPRDKPFRKLTERQRSLVLEGAGRRRIPLVLSYGGRRLRYRASERRRWEGVIPIIRRLHDRNPSRLLERFMAPAACSRTGTSACLWPPTRPCRCSRSGWGTITSSRPSFSTKASSKPNSRSSMKPVSSIVVATFDPARPGLGGRSCCPSPTSPNPASAMATTSSSTNSPTRSIS